MTYKNWAAVVMMAGLFACDETAAAKGAPETTTVTSSGTTSQSTTATPPTSKPTEPSKATCAAVIDKFVSLAPKNEAASAREIWTEMCEELTEDQRTCILSAKGTDEIDKCVDMKKQ